MSLNEHKLCLLSTLFSRVVNYDDEWLFIGILFHRKIFFDLIWLTHIMENQSKMSGIHYIPQQGKASNSIDTSFQVLTFWSRICLRFKVKIYVEINYMHDSHLDRNWDLLKRERKKIVASIMLPIVATNLKMNGILIPKLKKFAKYFYF